MVSIPFEGFIGPSYQLDNRYSGIERTVNWYLLANESQGESKWKYAFEPSPCNQAFCTLALSSPYNQPNRGLIENRGHVYGVNGATVFEIDSTGAFTNIGTVTDDGKPCSMVANGTGQVFIASAGLGYMIPNGGGAGSLVPITTADFLGASFATFQDGYIIVVTPNSNGFQISGTDASPLGDARLWSAANVSLQTGQQGYLRAVISSREYLRLYCDRRTLVYYNVGNGGIGGFPFQSYNETFIETGIAAVFSLADMGDSQMWIGQDARGQRACWRDSAFQPQRVSTFAVEQFWQSYARVDDAVAFPYIWKGHLIYRVTFPSAYESAVRFPLGAPTGAYTSATWEYDATLSGLLKQPIWCERAYQTALGYSVGRPELFHCYAFGKHLVGSGGADGNPGAVYQMADSPWTDCGTDLDGAQVQQQVVRDRICPHIFNGNKRIVYNRIEFELARGVGLDGAPPTAPPIQFGYSTDSGATWTAESQVPAGQLEQYGLPVPQSITTPGDGTNPQLLLRWSNDGGNTWTAEQNIPAGRIGEYGKRVYWNRCGYARDRVFWLRASDPVYWGIVGAELDVTPMAS